MRLVRLEVKRFQSIEAADVELGPGLNVLFGPNDVGKSSLAWAIRAVLLLQHNSSVHERFVSWYGGGEPQVTLTLVDDEERYWRVTKNFGTGTAGRSKLESSKDGRDFVHEGTARQVDEKLRAILRWGIQRPGGPNAPRGLPTSFLSHVLLAEQDDVRKILFESSLPDDTDESGRMRLTAALGALAQDPMFKRVLDESQLNYDRAFTSKGARRRSAGSPFVEIAEKLNALSEERDGLAARVKETELTEAKIRSLLHDRDILAIELEDAEQARARAEASFAAWNRREVLAVSLGEHQTKLDDVGVLHAEIDRRQRVVGEANARLSELRSQIASGSDVVGAADRALADVRQTFEHLSSGSAASRRVEQDLVEREQGEAEAVARAQRQVEHAAEVLRKAFEVSRDIQSLTLLCEHAATELRSAASASVVAVEAVGRARGDVDSAKQHMRDAQSGDRARARELTRQELENGRLRRSTTRDEIMHRLARATAASELIAKANATSTRVEEQRQLAASTREAVAVGLAQLEQVDRGLHGLTSVETYSRLRQVRRDLDATRAEAESADRARQQAELLRVQARELRSLVPRGMPTSDEIQTLRRLHDELRVADASMRAVSVTIRPRRAVTVQATLDGVREAAQPVHEATTLTASRILVLDIADVAELEVAGCDATAREVAVRLRERWDREGGPVLLRCGAESVESLADACREAERKLADAAALEREAEHADELARRRRSMPDDAMLVQLATLHSELDGADEAELEAKLAALGANWAKALRGRTSELREQRASCAEQVEHRRTQLARAEAQLESLVAQLGVENHAAQQAEVAFGEPWTAVAERAHHQLNAIDHELAEADRQLAALSQADTSDEATARAEVLACEAALASALEGSKVSARVEQAARDAATAAATHLEAARERGSALGGSDDWRAALRERTPLSTAPWQAELRTAGDILDACKQRHAVTRAQLEEQVRARDAALLAARTARDDAESTAASARHRLDELRHEQSDRQAAATNASEDLNALRVQEASVDVASVQGAVAQLRAELESLGQVGERVDVVDVESGRNRVARLAQQVRDVDAELTKSRGALEFVGGAVVRDQISELDRAIEQYKEHQRAVEVEYDAWKLLLTTLRDAESTEGQHLGRQLAGPVSQRFRQLTGGRYGQLELGVDLGLEGVRAAGEVRDIGALSAGTQDQLATLLRMCIAEQLQSSVVLDDHLSQSDPARVAWFNEILRASSERMQVVFITCRPHELLLPTEFPADGEAMRSILSGSIRAIDLSQLIRRYKPAA